ncbi:MAG: methionine biosynthesis protein MetW [Elusimicrobia bacterium RIFOXYD2_FULL_34_15]|nr:MAG: methionine biosynthesis protein MetW [Elusimicrobia bacterium RIFOXYD2_FULL_34_15]
MEENNNKIEYKIMMDWISEDASVLDLGCGNGEFLSMLVQQKKVKAQGIELDEHAIYKCVERGISVFHEDLDNGLKGYPDKSFDYVILYQSLQQIKKPDVILHDAIKVGKKVIVGIPNFAYYKARLQIFFKGTVPVTPSLPYQWYDTPNLHFLSISDFINYCKNKNFNIEKSVFIEEQNIVKVFPNLFALTGIFLISE